MSYFHVSPPFTEDELDELFSDTDYLHKWIDQCVEDGSACIRDLLNNHPSSVIRQIAEMHDGQLSRIKNGTRLSPIPLSCAFVHKLLGMSCHELYLRHRPKPVRLTGSYSGFAQMLVNATPEQVSRVYTILLMNYPLIAARPFNSNSVRSDLFPDRIKQVSDVRVTSVGGLFTSAILDFDCAEHDLRKGDETIRDLPYVPSFYIKHKKTASKAVLSLTHMLRNGGFPQSQSLITLSLLTNYPLDYFVSNDYYAYCPTYVVNSDSGEHVPLTDPMLLKCMTLYSSGSQAQKAHMFALCAGELL